MLEQLVECVPNVSEGRNAASIAEMADAVKRTSGVVLADIHSDSDHNRTVYTFYGNPSCVQQAAVNLAICASRVIDMRIHDGMHPCLGALDVCPFVPMQNYSMSECVLLARSAAQMIAEQLHMPVYLYEKAALMPHRTSLPVIRKGGYKGRVGQALVGDWLPDFGPQMLHSTAGASIVGARSALVAYNINMDGPYIEGVQQIARNIRRDRKQNPALKGVRALGLMLPSRNMAQVSMNLTKPQLTPIEGVYGYVCEQAQALGIPVAEAELVGCLPVQMIQSAMKTAFGLSNIRASQILPIDL